MSLEARRSALAATKRRAQIAPFSSPIDCIPMLLAQPSSVGERNTRRHAISGIPGSDTETLVARIGTSTDPIVLWALHLHLDRRGVPPCIRWPANIATPQAEFITLLADLLWLCRRLPSTHRPAFRGWRNLWKEQPGSPAWHQHALRQYLFVAQRGSIGHWCATGLALSDAQRADLMMLPTAAMRATRTALHPSRVAAVERQLVDLAEMKPDRAREHSPHAVAVRRLRLWRVWVLSDRSPTRTAESWHLLTGERLSRQRVSALIDHVDHRGAKRKRRTAQ
jgi:hypothetical protein